LRAVIQRVERADIKIARDKFSEIQVGYVVLLGIESGDTLKDVGYMVRKIHNLKLFGERFDRSIQDEAGEILVISQFTLLADCRKGRRPDWSRAAGAEEAEPLYQAVLDGLRQENLEVREGSFGAKMRVNLVNDGPVTIILDSRERGKKVDN